VSVPFYAFVNNLAGVTLSSLTASSGSQSLTVPSGFAAAINAAMGAGQVVLLTLATPTQGTENEWEIVACTAAVTGSGSDTLTITRAFEGTPTCPSGGAGLAWAAGAKVEARATAGIYANLVESWLDQRKSSASGIPAGAAVGEWVIIGGVLCEVQP
jgi:hypothetical protein